MQIHHANSRFSSQTVPAFGQAGLARRTAQGTFIAALALAGAAGDSANLTQTAPAAIIQACDSANIAMTTTDADFSLPIACAQQFLQSADGMQEDKKWRGYPKHSINTWGVGFNNSGEFETDPSDKKDPDDILDFQEAHMAAEQLAWDMSLEAQSGNDGNINGKPISPEFARQARAFFLSIFWNAAATSPPGQAGKLRPGADANHDGVFTIEDLLILSQGRNIITDDDFTNAGR